MSKQNLPPAKGIELLGLLREKAQEFCKEGVSAEESSAWRVKARNVLERVFGEKHRNVNAVLNVRSYSKIGAPESYYAQARQQDMCRRVGILSSLIKVLQLDLTNADDEQAAVSAVDTDDSTVFVVHGRNATVLREVESFLNSIGLVPVILQDQPNLGRTLIEKFEEHAAVRYAIVVMTADDVGVSRDEFEKSVESPRPRARQNVVLELGFFIGSLGREAIAVLFEAGIEKPSDFEGVAYVPLDGGEGWKFKLLRELKAAGLKLDL
jgi:predicted nucleotide-binding protein